MVTMGIKLSRLHLIHPIEKIALVVTTGIKLAKALLFYKEKNVKKLTIALNNELFKGQD